MEEVKAYKAGYTHQILGIFDPDFFEDDALDSAYNLGAVHAELRGEMRWLEELSDCDIQGFLFADTKVQTAYISEFLMWEFEHYKHQYESEQEFAEGTIEMIQSCEECGVLYWEGCKKRCEHE